MGRAGNIFSCFKEFPPRYVPGTDFSGSPGDSSFEGWLDSNYTISIYGKQSAPIKIWVDEEDSVFDSSQTSANLLGELLKKWLTKSTQVKKCLMPFLLHCPKQDQHSPSKGSKKARQQKKDS